MIHNKILYIYIMNNQTSTSGGGGGGGGGGGTGNVYRGDGTAAFSELSSSNYGSSAIRGGPGKESLDWPSQAVKDELAALPKKIRSKAKRDYISAVQEASRRRPHHDMRRAKEKAKERLNDLKNNIIYNEDTGNSTGESGEGGEADILMREAIVSAQTPKKKKMRGHPGGGRRRRTRRSRRKRRKTKRRRRRRRTKRRRRRRRTKRRS